MTRVRLTTCLFSGLLIVLTMGTGLPAHADPCLEVTLTGTMGGPATFNGLAGAGTLVRYGDDSTGCNDVRLQFDLGRATTVRLSELGLTPNQIDAIFVTHLHSDHVDDLAVFLQNRWHLLGATIDVVCSADAPSPPPPATPNHFMSCQGLLANIDVPFTASGEIAQRRSENGRRDPGGPSALANVLTFTPGETPAPVWTSADGAVVVRAIRSNHVAGHASYRVDTPAGSVVVGGDAGNDLPAPPRPSSTSANVELLAQSADVLVHSTIHPVMGPNGGGNFPPPLFFRQSNATDIGAMAERAGVTHVLLTHLIPPLGAVRQGPFNVPGGPLDKGDYKDAVKAGGYRGDIRVGEELLTLRIPDDTARP